MFLRGQVLGLRAVYLPGQAVVRAGVVRAVLPVLPAIAKRRASSSARPRRSSTVVRLEDLPQGVLGQAAPAGRTDTIAGGGRRKRKTKVKVDNDEVDNDEINEVSEVNEVETDNNDEAGKNGKNDGEVDFPPYPTVILQARSNMHKFANCILLTRVGGFYELYFEHAQEFGPLLNLKVAAKKTNAGLVPMAGFPFFQLDRFLKILVHDLNRYVAIAEEFPNDAGDRIKSGGLLHDRRVARIVTPGTLIDENFMDPYTNNYVMAIHPAAAEPPASASVGLAWLDLSTGHFSTQVTTLPALGSALSRVAPREVVLDEALRAFADPGGQAVHPVLAALADDRQHVLSFARAAPVPDGAPSLAAWPPVLEAAIPPETAAALTADEIVAGSLLLHYVADRLQGLAMKLQPPVRYEGMQVMAIDKNSMRSLEIKQTLRDGLFRGSLLHAIRRTVTKGGARLLNEWLSAPSADLACIEGRLDLVDHMMASEHLRDGVTLLLRRTCDVHRLVQKFALSRGDPDDLLDLAKTIAATEDIVGLLLRHRAADATDAAAASDVTDATDADATDARDVTDADLPKTAHGASLHAIVSRIHLDRPLAVAQRIRDSVDEEGLQHQHELEDTEADALMTLAEAVQANAPAGSSKKAVTAAAAAKDTLASSRRKTSFRDVYGEDNEVWVMKPSASKALAVLHAQLVELDAERDALTRELRRRFDAPSLALKWTPGLGHICHVRKPTSRRRAAAADESSTAAGDADADPPEHTTLSSSKTTRSLHVPAWTALGQKIDQARFHIRAEEQRVFQVLRADVVRALVPLRRNAAVLDELDIATAFARLAREQNLTRPRLNRGTATTIVGGRHPTVEGGLTEQGRSFSRNDCFLGVNAKADNGSLWLITGPNMGGKSTFLRQNALITILAQVGCFVPAEYAELGLVDALFSRVGSADNLFRDQSTFMVEMLETAHILRQATPRSFVIMDEIGRGTTPEDGTAVAFAALHHLVTVNRCRALFATHFHRLADLAAEHGFLGDKTKGAVELYCTDVEEDQHGGFVYVHRLRPGINRQSHALKVAKLAGLPETAMQVAKQVLLGV